MCVCCYDNDDNCPGDTVGVTVHQMPQAELASSPAQQLLGGPPMQLAAASGERVHM